MNNISMNQALSIWSELWQAYYGDNSYGTDTAEIYAYRLMPYRPITQNSHVSSAQATNSLAGLLMKFEADMNYEIKVDGKTIRDWVGTEIFDHRCHVKVVRK